MVVPLLYVQLKRTLAREVACIPENQVKEGMGERGEREGDAIIIFFTK